MPAISITVNGVQKNLDVPADMPLLWALRDHLGLTGAKYGCGVGACGSCAVLLDGVAFRSCQIGVGDVGARKVITIEGLSPNGDHPLQKAWVEHDVSQCGYCQTGKIIEAAALLNRKPSPTDADIDQTFSTHICRCGTYQRIREAIHAAAKAAR
ncbi:MAG TPA: (2Fe-2S)-binding protein [Fimbriimonadaceae bacterium]|nr:(2Fe-2S)-binding protein [Fimbriimonadaceae bacterium]HRJ97123.1 (2Fe-2S)-binding protein [Fimbriimonadaceae bacterium]